MEKIIKVGGFDTFYREEGSGKNLLLLHGWGGNNKSFTPVFNSLKNYFHVYCPDLWGFGDSAAPADGADTYWYADMVMEFAARVGAREAHIIGHSFGGRIAVLLAAEYPEFVGKLVLCDAAGNRLLKAMFTGMLSTVNDFIATMYAHIMVEEAQGNALHAAHREIVDALRAHDETAAIRAIWRHFEIVNAAIARYHI